VSTTIYERGDTLLLNVPLNNSLEMSLRPVMLMQDCTSLDPWVSVVPITPDPMVDCNSMLIPLGSFESARMGFLTNAYLNATEEILVPRQFICEKIGKCPYRLLNDFLKTYRHSLGYNARASAPASVTAASPAIDESLSPHNLLSPGLRTGSGLQRSTAHPLGFSRPPCPLGASCPNMGAPRLNSGSTIQNIALAGNEARW
jgi:hypothetical protein